MIFGGDVFRYVILPSLHYTIVNSAKILQLAFSSPLWLLRMKGKSFSQVCLYLQLYFFLTFTRLFLQLLLTISLALIATNPFSDRRY